MSKAGFKNPEEYFNDKAPMKYHVITLKLKIKFFKII